MTPTEPLDRTHAVSIACTNALRCAFETLRWNARTWEPKPMPSGWRR